MRWIDYRLQVGTAHICLLEHCCTDERIISHQGTFLLSCCLQGAQICSICSSARLDRVSPVDLGGLRVT